MRKFAFAVLGAFMALMAGAPAWGQCSTYTTVTGTVTDPNSIPYALGTVTLDLLPSGGTPTCTPASGGTRPQFATHIGPVPLDTTGSFTVQLPPQSIITDGDAAGWQFTVAIAPGAILPLGTGPQSFHLKIVITTPGPQSVSSTLSAAAPALSNINGGGGGTIVAGAQYLMPTYTLAGTHNTLGASGISTDSTLNDLNVPGFEDVTGDLAIGGPRPWIDVTAPPYNAKGDSSTDDTAAISAAITAACATVTPINSFAMHPAVVFPPGIYRVQQPQTPSTAAVFPLPTNCSFLEFRGMPGGSAVQFGNPAAQITVLNGASPNNAPVFQVNAGNADIRFKDLSTQGYNQAIYINNTNHVVFDNAPMTAAITGQTDNTPLKITNMLEVYRINGSNAEFAGVTTTLPPVIYTVESGAQLFNLMIFTKDVTDSGGSEQAIIRAQWSGAGAFQEMIFRDVQVEDPTNGFLTLTNTSGIAAEGVGPWIFDHVTVEDGGGPIATINDSTADLGGVYLNDVNYDVPLAPVIKILAGHMTGFDCLGQQCAVSDANGNAIGQGRAEEFYGGMDNLSDNSLEPVAPTAGLYYGGPTLISRWCAQGGTYCAMGIDPYFGLLFGLGDSNAFSAGFKQTTKETVDIQFAALLPPTAFSGTATTGGSLSAATYYAQIWATTTSACNVGYSSSTYATGVAVSGANNAVNFSWTLPITTPSTPSGYCLQILTSAIPVSSITQKAIYVSGASTASFLYTGQTQTTVPVPDANQMASEHRFTQNALGINTLSPAYDIDVVHSTAANSGIRVPNIVDTALTPGTSPICPNGASGAFTTCASGGGGADYLQCTLAGLVAGDYFGVNGSGICAELVPGLTPIAITASGTTTMISSYRGEWISAGSTSGSQTFALPDGTTTGFTNNFYFKVCNHGTVGALSITNNGGSYTFNGAASPYSLPEGYCADIANNSTSTGWRLDLKPGLITGGTGISVTQGQFGTVITPSAVPLSDLATQAADTFVGNATGSAAAPTAVAWPTTGTNGCAGTTNALIYNTTTHAIGCNTISGGSSGLPLLTTATFRNVIANRSGGTSVFGEAITNLGTPSDGAPTTSTPTFDDYNTSAAFTSACATGCVGTHGNSNYAAQVNGTVYYFKENWPTNIASNTGRYWVGLMTNASATTLGATDTPGTANSIVAVRYSTIAGDSAPVCYTGNGTAGTTTAPSPAITPNQINVFEFDDLGSSGWTIKVNGTAVCTGITTDIPTSGATLAFVTSATANTANLIALYFYAFQETGQ
jgi:hypothetical protein